MMKASLKAKYDTDKAAATGGAAVTFNAGDFKLRASMTDATVVNGLSLNGLALAVEKPGSFIFNYDVPNKDFSFQFMNSIKILEKPLNLKYIHSRGKNRTVLDGTLVFDSANKVSANHVLGSGGCKLKYNYVHGGLTTFEPSYDTEKNSWDFAVSHKVYGNDVCKATYQTTSNNLGLEWSRNVYGDNVCRATYQTTSKNLGLEWSRSSKQTGSFKVSASLCLADMELRDPKSLLKLPKLTAESSWDFDI